MAKTTPWVKIKAEYLQGATPKELGAKYNLTAKQISDKANEKKWVAEKAEISEKVRETVQDKIEKYSNAAIEVLHAVMYDQEAKNADKVSAARVILDLSGWKKSKQEIIGEPIGIQKIYVTPDEVKKVKEHINSVINGQ